MTLRRLFAGKASVLVLILVALCAVGANPVALSAQNAPPNEYLALGDSLATGVGSLRCLFGCAARGGGGYVADFAAFLRQQTGRDIVVRDLAVNGETTTSMIGDYPANPTSRSQLARAVAEIANNGPAIGWVTLDIGGNDALARRGPRYSAVEKQMAVARVRENLETIVGTLVAALRQSGSPAKLILLGYYDPYGAGDSDLWALGEINQAIHDVAVEYGLRVASTYGPFVDHEQTYTWIACGCPLSVHPTDAGYAVIAAALADALTGKEAASGTISGTVRDMDGAPVAGATVWFGDGAAQTGPDGTYLLVGVPAGVPLTLGAFTGDPAGGVATVVTVAAGATQALDLSLPAADGTAVQHAAPKGYARAVLALVRAALLDVASRIAARGSLSVGR